MAEERLQKLLANAGVASRRKAEELITAGQVSVNGETVTALGSKADLDVDQVKVNGQVISKPKHFVYYAFNKPKDVVSTAHDPEGRTTIMSFFRGFEERIYPVGRLDYASEGLILLTNDGDFANQLLSPASQITKTYLVKANGALTGEQEVSFRQGIPMHGRKTAPAGLQMIREGDNPWYEVRLVEGRQNQIRIMFKHFGLLVEKLKRIKIAFLEVGDLKPGAYRTLTRPEMEHFRRILQLDGQTGPRPTVDLTRELHAPSPRASKSRRVPRSAASKKPFQDAPKRTSPRAGAARPLFGSKRDEQPGDGESPRFARPPRDADPDRNTRRDESRPRAQGGRPPRSSAGAGRPTTKPFRKFDSASGEGRTARTGGGDRREGFESRPRPARDAAVPSRKRSDKFAAEAEGKGRRAYQPREPRPAAGEGRSTRSSPSAGRAGGAYAPARKNSTTRKFGLDEAETKDSNTRKVGPLRPGQTKFGTPKFRSGRQDSDRPDGPSSRSTKRPTRDGSAPGRFSESGPRKFGANRGGSGKPPARGAGPRRPGAKKTSPDKKRGGRNPQ